MSDEYTAARERRMELVQIIADCADEIAAIDRRLPILQSQALESDLQQAEPAL